jgi:hypothetical protein
MEGNTHDSNNPSANTAIPAELQAVPARYAQRSPRRKKKLTDSGSSTPERSPSRLAAIAESPDDFFEDDVGEGEGLEVLHDVAGEQLEIENQIFGCKGTTPDTSLTVSSASGDYYSSCLDEDKSVSSRGSDSSDYAHGLALIPIVSDEPRPYYMMETRPGAAGSIVRVSHGQHQNLDNDIPLISLARSEGTTTPVSCTEGDRQLTETSAMVPVIRQHERSVYAMQMSSNNDFPPINPTPSDGSTSPVYIEDDIPCAGHGSIVPVLHGQEQSEYAINMPPRTGIPHISQARSDRTASPIFLEDDAQGAGRGETNSVDLGNERPRSSRTEATSAPVLDDDIKPSGYGTVGLVNNGNRRSMHAVKAPAISMPLVALSHRSQSDPINTLVQIEVEQIGAGGAAVPVNRNQAHLANGMESLVKGRVVLMDKVQSARSEGTSSPTSTHTTETKEYLYKLQSVRSESTPSSSTIYTREKKETVKSTTTPEHPEHCPSVYASKPPSTINNFSVLKSVRSEETLSPTSIYTSETKETVKNAKAPENPEHGRFVSALKFPSTNGSVLFEPADTPTRSAESPMYELKEQLAPGTSAYIDDDGSVEMVSDDEPAPLVEKTARQPLPRWSVAPASVKLDACNDALTKLEFPRMDRSLPSIGSYRGGFSKRSPPSPLVSTEPNPNVSEHAKRTLTATKVSRPVSQHRVDADPRRHEPSRKNRSLLLMGSDRGGFSKITLQRSSIQKAGEERNLTSTQTETSRLKIQHHVDTAVSPRLMRKMRLSRAVQERKTEDPSIEWKVQGPSSSEDDSSDYDSSDSIEQHVIRKKVETTRSLTESSPESILLTSSESESTEEQHRKETSRMSEKSRSVRETSSSRQTSKRQKNSKKAPLYSSSLPSFTKAQEQEATTAESLVSSVFSGLFSKVEEVDRMFFNPTLSPPRTATKKKQVTKRDDATFRDITAVRYGEESLDVPNGSPREPARF